MALWVPWRRFKAELDELREAIAVLRHLMGQHQHVTEAGFRQLQEEVRKMPTRDEWDAAVQQLADQITAENQQVTQALQDLRNQIANGVNITDQDLARVQQMAQDVGNIDPDTVTPPGGRKKS